MDDINSLQKLCCAALLSYTKFMASEDAQTPKSALLSSENAEAYGGGSSNGTGNEDTESDESSYEEYVEWYQCQLSLFTQYVLWNVSMILFNLLINGIFILLIIIKSKNDNHYGLLLFAIIQTVLRYMMNISGLITSKILSKDVLERNNNALFLFGIASAILTFTFDIVFMVYFNYILFYIKTFSIVIRIVWINILCILDIIIVIYCDYKYFKFIRIDLRIEYYQYKFNFWSLIIISISMFSWGLIQVLYVMINASMTALIQSETGFNSDRVGKIFVFKHRYM